MTTDRNSRFSQVSNIVPVNTAGAALENVRVDLPYYRPLISAQTRPDVTTYTVRADDTWRGLGQRFFHGQSTLWWAIAEFSGVVDPYTELGPNKTTPRAGGTLTVPTYETVVFDLIGQ